MRTHGRKKNCCACTEDWCRELENLFPAVKMVLIPMDNREMFLTRLGLSSSLRKERERTRYMYCCEYHINKLTRLPFDNKHDTMSRFLELYVEYKTRPKEDLETFLSYTKIKQIPGGLRLLLGVDEAQFEALVDAFSPVYASAKIWSTEERKDIGVPAHQVISETIAANATIPESISSSDIHQSAVRLATIPENLSLTGIQGIQPPAAGLVSRLQEASSCAIDYDTTPPYSQNTSLTDQSSETSPQKSYASLAPHIKRKAARSPTILNRSVKRTKNDVFAVDYKDRFRFRNELVEDLSMTLFILRTGLTVQRTGFLFGRTISHISSRFEKMVGFLASVFEIQTEDYPSQESLDASRPHGFPLGVSIIIDAFELEMHRPRKKTAYSALWSQYKQRTTAKTLIGIAPNGAITHVSETYPGKITDPQLFRQSNLKAILRPGSLILADRGFRVGSSLIQSNILLRVPDFKSKDSSFQPYQVIRSQELSRVRVHIERAICKLVNENAVFQRSIPVKRRKILNSMIKAAALIINLCAKPYVADINGKNKNRKKK